MSDSGTTGEDLIVRVLRPSGPGGTTTLSEIGALAALMGVRTLLRDSRIAMGLLVPDDAIHRRAVAPSSGTDLSTDDAYLRFLLAHPEIAADSITAEVLSWLVDQSGALSSVDEATVPLAWAFIAALLCFDVENSRVNDKFLSLLARPLAAPLAPGLTVRQARIRLANALRAQAQQQRRAESQRKRNSRNRGQVVQDLGQAKAQLSEHKSVRGVKKLSRDGQDPPDALLPSPQATKPAKPTTRKGKTS